MKQINEIERMQQLAGIISESQLNELDVSIVSSLAKNIYSDLKKQGKKVGLEFQNQSLADKGKAVSVGNTKEAGALMVWYSVEWINVVGFDSEVEAEELVKKYSSNEIEGKVGSVPGSKGFIAMFNLKQEKQRSKYNTSTYKYDRAQNSNDRKRIQELAPTPPEKVTVTGAVNVDNLVAIAPNVDKEKLKGAIQRIKMGTTSTLTDKQVLSDLMAAMVRTSDDALLTKVFNNLKNIQAK
jgi:hypothetical protein